MYAYGGFVKSDPKIKATHETKNNKMPKYKKFIEQNIFVSQ